MKPIHDELSSLVKRSRSHYFTWAVTWLALGLGAIIFPVIAALPIYTENWSKIVAGIGAIFAAAFGFLRPETRAAEYHARLAQLRVITTDVNLGVLSRPEDISKRLHERPSVPTGRVYGLINAPGDVPPSGQQTESQEDKDDQDKR